MPKNIVGKLIELAMAEKELTQEQLAEKLGIRQSMISQWVNGKSNPKTATLKKISKATGMPLNFFLENSAFNVGDNVSQIINAKDYDFLKREIELLKRELELERKEKELLKSSKKA
jgi:transcriptional regulator with XRE-family HTH domain